MGKKGIRCIMSNTITKFSLKPLVLAISSLLLMSTSWSAQSAIQSAICGVNSVEDACLPGDNIAQGGILTLRGYALDLTNGDRPEPGGHIVVRNEDTLISYKIPIQRTEIRPDVVSKLLPAGAVQGSTTGVLTPENMDLLNAGFIAQAFMASLPSGRYSVVEARVKMKIAGLTNISLDGSNRAMFQINQSQGSTFSIVDSSGTSYPLTLKKASGGNLELTGYPALRSGDYTVSASMPTPSGATTASLPIKYKRPLVSIPVSVPLVDAFPGQASRMTLVDPLSKRSISQSSLSVVVDSGAADTLAINGEQLTSGKKVALTSQANQTGSFKFKLADNLTDEGEATVKLFVEQPDAPDVELKIKRWNPANIVEAKPYKTTVASRVEDLDVDAKLIGSSADTCQGLLSVRPEVKLGQTTGIQCAIKYETVPEGFKNNPYRSNALRGSLPVAGPNSFEYRPGVVYTDPDTLQTAFYPAKSGVKTLMVTGVQPEAPVMNFRPDKNLEGFYKTSESRFPGKKFAQVDRHSARLAGNMNVKAGFRNISSKITYADGTEKTFFSSYPEANLPVAFSASDPWASYPVKFESFYTKAPDIKTEQIVDFVGIPLPPVVAFDRDMPSNDQQNTIVTGYMGMPKGQVVEFDPATMGTWTVTIETKDGQAIGSPATVGADGKFSVDLGMLTPGSRNVTAVAKMQPTGEVSTLDHTIKSQYRVLVTEKGNQIQGVLSARMMSGPAPFSQTINVDLKDSSLLRNTAPITWEVQDASGNWVPILNKAGDGPYTGVSYVASLSQAESKYYRATIKNKFSGDVFVTEPLMLQAYDLPSYKVLAPAVTVVGKPVTLSVQQETGFNATYNWKFISKGKVENQSSTQGESFTFTPTDNTGYVLEVSAQQVGAPSTDARSQVKKVVALKAVNPLIARASIDGPTFVETGKTYTFKAKINDVVSASIDKAYTLSGYWSLPDGSRVDGTELSYTVKPGDTGLNFVTYVDGHPEETSVAVHTWKSWDYVWPTNWKITMTPVYVDVPAKIKYRVEPVGFDLRQLMGENLTYTWSLPANVTATGAPSDGSFDIGQVGTYQVAVQVADTRGNAINITSDQFSVLPTAQVDLEPKLVSKYGDSVYAPGTYYVGVKVLSVPRGDSFVKNEIILNGAKVGEFVGTGSYVSFAQPGQYDLTIRTLTKLNNYGEKTLSIVVQEPPAPSCNVTSKMMSTGLYVTSGCTLDVGYVRSYKWTYLLDGQQQQSTGKNFSALKSWLDGNRISNLQLTVESDLGKTTTIPVSLQ